MARIDIQSILRQIPQRRSNTLIDYDPVTLTDVRTPTQGEVFASIAGGTVSKAVDAYTKSKSSEREASRQFDILKFQEEIKDERQERQNVYQKEIKKIDRKYDLDKLKEQNEYEENLNKEKEETKREKDKQDFIFNRRQQFLLRKDQQKRLELQEKQYELAEEERRDKKAKEDLDTSIENISRASDLETVIGEIAGMRDDTFASQSTKRIFKADYDKHAKALEVIKSLDSEFGGRTYKEIRELENGDKKLEAYFNNPAWYNENFERTVPGNLRKKKTKLEAFHNDYQLNKGWYDWVAKGGVKTMFKNVKSINDAAISLIENSKAEKGQATITNYLNVQFANMKDADKQRALSIKNALQMKFNEKSELLTQIGTTEIPAGSKEQALLDEINREIDILSNEMNSTMLGVNFDDDVNKKVIPLADLNTATKQQTQKQPEVFSNQDRMDQAADNIVKANEIQKSKTNSVIKLISDKRRELIDKASKLGWEKGDSIEELKGLNTDQKRQLRNISKTLNTLESYLDTMLERTPGGEVRVSYKKYTEENEDLHKALKAIGYRLPSTSKDFTDILGLSNLTEFNYSN